MADFWIIEWHDNFGNDVTETADTPEEAVEVLRRFLATECFAATSDSSGSAPSAFDELFQGAAPAVLLRHVRTVVGHECMNGRFVIRRVRSSGVTVPVAAEWEQVPALAG